MSCSSPARPAPGGPPPSTCSRIWASRRSTTCRCRFVPRLLDGPPRAGPLALGIDVRNRDFSVAAPRRALSTGCAPIPHSPSSCSISTAAAEVLVRRYSETRRRHPAAPGRSPPRSGSRARLDLLAPAARARADVLIDTSDLTPHDLRGEIARWFGRRRRAGLARLGPLLLLQARPAARHRHGVRLPFPAQPATGTPTCAPRDGRDAAVAAYVAADPRFMPFLDQHRRPRATCCCRPIAGGGQGASGDRLRLHRRPAPLGRGGRKPRAQALAEAGGRCLYGTGNSNGRAAQASAPCDPGWRVRDRNRDRRARRVWRGNILPPSSMWWASSTACARSRSSADDDRAAKQAEICARGRRGRHRRRRRGRDRHVRRIALEPRRCRPARRDDRRILYGANLPMLIKLAKSRAAAGVGGRGRRAGRRAQVHQQFRRDRRDDRS